MDIRATSTATTPYTTIPPTDAAPQRVPAEAARNAARSDQATAPPEQPPPPDTRATRSRQAEDLSPQGAAAQAAYQFQTLQDPGTRAAQRQVADAQARQGSLNLLI